jgi:hypothetical protein
MSGGTAGVSGGTAGVSGGTAGVSGGTAGTGGSSGGSVSGGSGGASGSGGTSGGSGGTSGGSGGTCTTATHEAEAMTPSAAGVGQAQGSYYVLWANGALGTTASFNGAHTITVYAGGTAADTSHNPHLVVEVNGAAIGDAAVTPGTAFNPYAFNYTGSGAQPLMIRFDNDYFDSTSGSDTNLFVDRVIVGCGSAGTGGTGATGGTGGGTGGTGGTGGNSGSGGSGGSGGSAGSGNTTGCDVPSRFQWTTGAPIIAPRSDASHDLVAVKDPTVARFNGRWHVYASSVSNSGVYGMVYTSFTDWATVSNAT